MMPVRSLIGIAILLILANGAFAFGQSERSQQSALSTTARAPQILLQVKFYEFDLTSENESAGFRSKRMQATSKNIPVLSSIPMIGDTFKSQSTTAVESERFILATTRVVQPE